MEVAWSPGTYSSANEFGRLWASLTWTNWCGPSSVQVRLTDPMLGGGRVLGSPVPTCRDRTKPSVLRAHVAG